MVPTSSSGLIRSRCLPQGHLDVDEPGIEPETFQLDSHCQPCRPEAVLLSSSFHLSVRNVTKYVTWMNMQKVDRFLIH